MLPRVAQLHVNQFILFKLTPHKICDSLGGHPTALMEVRPCLINCLRVLQREPVMRRLHLLKSEFDICNTAGNAVTHWCGNYARRMTCSGLLASSVSALPCSSRSIKYEWWLAIVAMERTPVVLSCSYSRHVTDSSVTLVHGFAILAIFANRL